MPKQTHTFIRLTLLYYWQITDASDIGDKESSMLEAHSEMPSRTAAPSQASTMMPASYDKSTSLAGDGKLWIFWC